MTSPISSPPASDYCQQMQTGEFLESSPFSADDNNTKWILRLFPKGVTPEYEDYLAVGLGLVACNRPQVKAMFKFSILNAKREEKKAKDSQGARIFETVRARKV